MFALDPQLAADTRFVAARTLCDVRLMDDRRFPWLVLVPRVDGASELFDLSEVDRRRLVDEAAEAGRALKRATGADKINIGALGNVVRQLHVHVVARFAADAAWPGPVWGFGAGSPYDDPAPTIDVLRRALG